MDAVLNSQIDNLKEELEAKKGQITSMLEALKHQAAEKRKIEDQIITDKEKH